MEVIKVSNLKKTYSLSQGKTLEAVKDISFSVQNGEIFGILGPNGAGKTTTLEIMEGLITQSAGTVNILGFDNLKQIDQIKNKIGVQLQSSQYLPYLSLEELLELFASFYNQKVINHELLKLVDLENKSKEPIKSLSGGQKQRFTIATSLVNKPEILFLDEPTTGLDPHARRQMWELIKNINKKGVTIVITTHYMEEAEFLCNRVAIMDSGKILKMEEPAKLIEDLSHTTEISFFSKEPLQNESLKGLESIAKIYNDFPKISMEINSLDHISTIVEFLNKNNIKFSGFTVRTASLEDVYLRLTGHAFEE